MQVRATCAVRQFYPARHRSLQYFTDSQSRAHFFRQENGRPQVAQIFSARSPGSVAREGGVTCGRRGMPNKGVHVSLVP